MNHSDSKPVALTGDRPTGPLHLGHYVGSLRNRLALQETHRQFIMIADLQALTDNIDRREKIEQNIRQVLLDYLAVGIDPNKTTIFLQSAVPQLAELAFHFLNFVTVARLERNPTVKEEIRQKGFARDIPAGFLTYPVSQAADILAFNADVVPVGNDQLAMIEQTNEIVRRVNACAQQAVFRECTALVGSQGRLPGIDGQAKMSKSLNNTIDLRSGNQDISRAVQKMFTDPNHLRVSDPGRTEGNVVFDYLAVFDPDQTGLAELAQQYRRGGIGDSMVKGRLNSILQTLLEPIRNRREILESNPKELVSILEKGNIKARKVADHTLSQFKAALHIGHF